MRIILTGLLIIVIALAYTSSCSSNQSIESVPSSTSETPASTIENPQTTTKNTTTLLETMVVHFIDVGQGDAILIDLGEIEILIDGGDRSPGITDYLSNFVDDKIEVMVATHPHADHIGGLIDVLEQYVVEEIWHNGDTSTSKTYQDFMTAVQSEGAEVNIASTHDTIQFGEIYIKVHNPVDLSGSTNNNSIVLHLAYGTVDFLFMGDAETEAEGHMMMLSSLRVPEVEILKLGHHCSRTASSDNFIAITSPEVAIYMAGEGNVYGHPHIEALDTLDASGATIYGTDVHGTISVTTDGENYTLQTEKQNPPVQPSMPSSPTPSTTTTEPISIPATTTNMNANVVINKIFADGLVPTTEADEYVEITNLGNDPIDLKDWELIDISEGYPSFTFPSFILQPEQSVRVYTNEVHPEWGGFSFGSDKAVWNNSDPDTAVLYDSKGTEVSRKSY